ncbi:hypothetical protein SLA2020_417340 [Shorea laevis]
MAITFSDLHTEAGLKSLDEFLAGKNLHLREEWYECVSSHLANSFPGKAVGVRIGGKGAPAAAAPAKADAGDGDDDDLDLFGDETEEEKKAAEEREAAKKASSKKKESGKSSILMDIKPWDDETDMKKLEEAVRSVEMPGLLWGASKLAPVGYGIKKLQIMLTIVDDLVSVDSLIEEHLTVEPCSEYVQSCDIVAFNKIRKPPLIALIRGLAILGIIYIFCPQLPCSYIVFAKSCDHKILNLSSF